MQDPPSTVIGEIWPLMVCTEALLESRRRVQADPYNPSQEDLLGFRVHRV